MSLPYSASMPDDIDCGGSYTVRVTAVDPTNGNVIAAITIESLVMVAEPLGATTPIDLAFGPFQLVPGPGA